MPTIDQSIDCFGSPTAEEPEFEYENREEDEDEMMETSLTEEVVSADTKLEKSTIEACLVSVGDIVVHIVDVSSPAAKNGADINPNSDSVDVSVPFFGR